MQFIACAAFAAWILGVAIPAHADPIPSVLEMNSDIQGIYSDFSNPEIRSLFAKKGKLHFMTMQMSLKPADDVPEKMRGLQAEISSLLGKCAEGFGVLDNAIGTSKEAEAWQIATSCLDRQNILEGFAMGEFHGDFQLDPKPYASLAALIDKKVSDVLPDY